MPTILVKLLQVTLLWPQKIGQHLLWFAPLMARLTIGEVFMTSGLGKLQNLDAIIENFISWGIPFPEILTPFVAGLEFFGGIFLMLGLFTRIFAGALGITMIVAIKSALWAQVDSLDTLLGFSETAYLIIFLWLAIAGGGKLSLDDWLIKKVPA
jgi:putative oxidoreductase